MKVNIMIKAIRTALLSTVAIAAFDSGKAGWKMDGDKIATDASGNPIFIKNDGSEQSLEIGAIGRLNAENKQMRDRAEAAEKTVKAFEGLDPEAARKAIETVSKIDAKALIDAGEVDKVKAQISEQFTSQLSERDKKIAENNGTIEKLRLENAFKGSDFIANRIAIPRDMFEATFAKNFKVNEDGNITATDTSGNIIYSKTDFGKPAGVDEAFEILVEGYTHKDQILKSEQKPGSGNGGGGGNRPGSRIMKRADFEKLNPQQQGQAGKQAATGELQIVD